MSTRRFSVASVVSLIVLSAASVSLPAWARPVSYLGGWTLIEESNRQHTAALLHYTVDPRWSLGWRTERDRNNDFAVQSLQATWLAKRWLGQDHQGNVYAYAGAGFAHGVEDTTTSTQSAGYVGVMADWETRRYFAGYMNRYLDANALGSQFLQTARVGWAPYEGATGDLHPWLMLEVDHRPQSEEHVGVTPLLRFFKGTALLEVGYNLKDHQPLVNFTWRF